MPALALLLSLPVFLAAGGDRPYSDARHATAGGSRCEHLPPVRAARAKANDNRAAAGVRRGDTLFLSLVATTAAWYPESADGCAIGVLAFAEAGKEPSIPGPLIRVRAGTALRISVRNAVGRQLWLRGFYDRPINAPEAVD